MASAPMINEALVRVLKDALEHADLYHHKTGLEGGINPLAPEDLDRVKIYLDSWVCEPLRLALRHIERNPQPGDSQWLIEHYGARRNLSTGL